MKKKLMALGLGITSAVILGGCNLGADPLKGMGDSGINYSRIEKTPVTVIEFSDKYPNIEEKCDGAGYRIFTNTRQGGYFVVVPDASCKAPSYQPQWRTPPNR